MAELMKSSIKDYLPPKSSELMLVQGRVPRELGQQVREILDAESLSWADCLKACLTQFALEIGSKKKS